MQKNKRQKKRGQWFYDNWLINKVRWCIFAFGYRLTYDIYVLMPKIMFPLLIVIKDADPIFYIMIAPRRGFNDEKRI